MKTVIKLLMSVLLLAGLMVSSGGCKKEKLTGYLTVKMTDAPAVYSEVNVEVIGVNVHVENVGWVNLPVKPGIYNLLELQHDATIVLADNVEVPAGSLSQFRLLLGTNNSVVTTEGEFALKVPSGSESGLKINVHQTILRDKHLILVIDFDANASVVVNGNGEFILKPVIKVKSAIQI